MLAISCVATFTWPYVQDLFHELDSRLPRGDYRIPSLVATTNGTLLAFVNGRFHRTDQTPDILYMRRSLDDGNTWEPAQAVLADPTNRTEFGGAPVVDPATGDVVLLFQRSGDGCAGCRQWVTRSSDHGASWSPPQLANLTEGTLVNATYGGALASGIALKHGPHAGRLLVALRHDCGGCSHPGGSFVMFSDDHGATWSAGGLMTLLPKYGGGWYARLRLGPRPADERHTPSLARRRTGPSARWPSCRTARSS